MKTETKSVVLSRALTLGVVGVVALSLSAASLAGTGGEAFDDVWSTLTDWTQGTLGRIIAGSMVLVGIVGGIARQSLMAFALGVGGGMGLYNTPTVLESVMSATPPVAPGALVTIDTAAPGMATSDGAEVDSLVFCVSKPQD